MKYIVVSDIHVHKYKRFNKDNRRLNSLIKLLEDVWELAYKNKATVLFCGDMFNNMQLMHTEVVDAVTKSFTDMTKKYPDVTWVMISGNHDYATKNFFDRPAVSALNSLARVSDNIIVNDNRTYDDVHVLFYGLPYYEYKEDLEKALKELRDLSMTPTDPEDELPRVLLMHQTVGLDIDMVPDDIDPNNPLFSSFDMVFNGHIHQFKQVRPGFYNVGSPLHRDAGDIGQEKGVLLFDSETGSVERIILDYPQFRYLPAGTSLPPEWENDYVIEVPDEVEVTVEEEEIQEKFNPTKKSKSDLLNSFLDMHDVNTEVRTYGNKLLSHATEV